MDMTFPLSLTGPSLVRATLVKDCAFQLHSAPPASCFGRVAGLARSAEAFDAVDYGVDLMFNQTKWNDALDQRN
jgi:hypothetical protein